MGLEGVVDLFSWRDASTWPREERERGSVRELVDDGLAPSPTAPFGDVLGEDGRPALPSLGAQDPFVLKVNLERVRRRDPGFDPQALAARAAEAMATVETAWSELDPQPSRAVLAPPLWSSHRARMELYRLHGRRNVVDHLQVQDAQVVAVEQDEQRERVTVRIRASSTDYDVDTAGTVVRGDTEMRTWRADWVLERSAAALSRADGGLLGRHCPACGAPLALDAEGLCSYCHAVPTDAQRDWVVVGVSDVRRAEEVLRATIGVRTRLRSGPDDLSPADEVVALDPSLVPHTKTTGPDALAPLRMRDPEINATGIITTARAAFSGVCAAWRAMDVAPARPMTSEEGLHTLQVSIDAVRARGCTRVVDDPVIDDVTVLLASDGAEWDAVTVRVTAVMVDADVDASGAVVRGDTEPRLLAGDLVLRRRVPGSGNSVEQCPRCGAPLRASVTGVCDYCRAAIAGGGGDWILEAPPRLATVAPGAPAVHAEAAGAAQTSPLDPLRARDPSLNEAEILARARECFYTVEKAQGQGHLDGAQSCITEGLRTRLQAALDAQRQQHRHRVLAFIDIAAAHVAGATGNDDGERITVRIEVTGEDCVVDDATGAAEGTTAQRRWTEDWTLLRGPATGGTWLVDAVTGPA